MIVIHNGNEYNVTNKFTLGQLLKHGAVPVEEQKEVIKNTEIDKSENKKPNISRRKSTRK